MSYTAEIQELAEKSQRLINEMDQAVKTAKTEGRDLSSEEQEKVAKIRKDLGTLRAQREQFKAIDDERAYWDAPAEPAVRTPIPGAPAKAGKPEDDPYRMAKGLRALVTRDFETVRALNLSTGSAGAILVPDEVKKEIRAIDHEEVIVRPRANVIPAGSESPDAKVTLPCLKQGSTGVDGGFTYYWKSKKGGTTMTESEPVFDGLDIEPLEIYGYTLIDDSLLANAAALEAWLRNWMRKGVNNQEDYAFLVETGDGVPEGITQCPGKLSVARNTTSQIKWEDPTNMECKLIQSSRNNAVFICSMSAKPYIVRLVDAGSNSIFIRGDVTRGIPDTLLGYPIFFTGKTPALGSASDLILADFSYYNIKDGSGPIIALSSDVKFLENQTAIKIVWHVDGRNGIREPLTLENASDQVSNVVYLAA